MNKTGGHKPVELVRAFQEKINKNDFSLLNDRETRVLKTALTVFVETYELVMSDNDFESICRKITKSDQLVGASKKWSDKISSFFRAIGGALKVIFCVRVSERALEQSLNDVRSKIELATQQTERYRGVLKDHFGQTQAREDLEEQKEFWKSIKEVVKKDQDFKLPAVEPREGFWKAVQELGIIVSKTRQSPLRAGHIKELSEKKTVKERVEYVKGKVVSAEKLIQNTITHYENFEKSINEWNNNLRKIGLEDAVIDLEQEKQNFENRKKK